ncbi:MAG: extracellular solute-binding protein [Chloroherpetonaceae bacterium]|nr:extracellular solute-binding protein [Chloroherpetonaceae bacterium]
MPRQRFAFLIALALLSLSACGDRREKIITIWTQMQPGERKVLDAALEKFAKEDPVGREWTKKGYVFRELFYETEPIRTNFMIAALGGSGAELVYGPSDMVGPFTKLQIIHALDSLPDGAKFEQAFLDSFITEPFPANTYLNGHLYQIADQIGNHLCLVYNKDLISEPPKTISEMIEIGKRFTKDGKYGLVWNYTEPYFFIPFVTSYGGGVMNERAEPTLNSEATIKAARLVVELRDKHKIIPRDCDYQTANALFKEGRAAMIINGPWSWASYKSAGMNFGVARIPLNDETGLYPAPMVSPRGYSINVNARGEKLRATVDLLKFLCSPEIELEFTKAVGTIPSRREAFAKLAEIADDNLRGSMEQIMVGKPMPVVSEMRVIWDSMRPSYQAVLNGSKTPEQAAQEMQDLAMQLIREMKE